MIFEVMMFFIAIKYGGFPLTLAPEHSAVHPDAPPRPTPSTVSHSVLSVTSKLSIYLYHVCNVQP